MSKTIKQLATKCFNQLFETCQNVVPMVEHFHLGVSHGDHGYYHIPKFKSIEELSNIISGYTGYLELDKKLLFKTYLEEKLDTLGLPSDKTVTTQLISREHIKRWGRFQNNCSAMINEIIFPEGIIQDQHAFTCNNKLLIEELYEKLYPRYIDCSLKSFYSVFGLDNFTGPIRWKTYETLFVYFLASLYPDVITRENEYNRYLIASCCFVNMNRKPFKRTQLTKTAHNISINKNKKTRGYENLESILETLIGQKIIDS